jgi:hypothetical protein
MLNPCANISIAPWCRLGSISLLYIRPWLWSGVRIITTSAHFAASATVATSSPAARAFSIDRLVAGSPTFTLIPLSLRFNACACPCDP